MSQNRRLAIGAEIVASKKTHFRVWGPDRRRVELVVEGSIRPNIIIMEKDKEGYFSAQAAVGAGTCYRFRLDDGPECFPDPASRFQPDGPHGPSQVIDPHAFAWNDASWPGIGLEGQV